MIPEYMKNMPKIPMQREPMEGWLWSKIEQGMYKKETFFKKAIHASSAHCPRFNALTLNREVENESLPALSLYAQIGNCVEGAIVDSLQKSDLLVDTQYRPKLHDDDPPLHLSGIIDILYLNQHNQLALLEIKSTGQIDTKESPYYKKDGTIGKSVKQGVKQAGPSLTHKTQAEIYAGLTGIADVKILYISRNVIENFGDGIAHQEFEINTSYQNLYPVFVDLYYAQLCNESGITPIRPANFRKTIECKFCNFVNECHSDNSEETDEHETMRKLAETKASTFMSNIHKRRAMVEAELKEKGKLL